jgi:hypothetical protein
MANRYLLPCECGKSVTVGVTQAGEDVTCECGQRLTVPTLRGLQQLVPVADQPIARPGWSALQGYLFSLGLLALLIGCAIGIWQTAKYLEMQPYSVDRSADFTKLMNADVDKMTPLETLEDWKHAQEHGLSSDQSPQWIEAQAIAAYHLRILWIAFIAAGLGLIALVASLVIRPAK